MNNKSIIKGFLFPTLLQITVVAALVGILKAKGYELGYNSFLGMVFIIFGGVSSALWGVFYQIKYNAKRPLRILKDFFDIKQSIKIYAVVLVFLFMDFCSVIVSKGFKIESLLILLVLFFEAIAFGGIEEIGWRYSFQPCLEKKIPYIAATIITFLCWSIWHFLFFYIDGSIEIVNVPYFLLGLLTNCFIFSALFAYSNSLWICVMTHALINTLSQITVNDNALIGNIFKVVCICFACLLFHVSKRKNISYCIPADQKLFNGECMKKRITLIVFSVLIIVALYVLYCFNYIPHKKYTNADFNIEAYKSNIDKDNDGIDDQTDILNNANNYIKTNPKYKSKYYNTGYPNDEYGVCTDVVAFALKDAGYDLMELVNEDIKNNKELYDMDAVDKNIDFRRVKNLKVYFDNNAISLTTDINEIEEWQGGDIVVFKKHIGIISDKRNRKGICFVIHHANPYQIYYEEDILEHRDDIIGHYRIS